MICVKKDLAKAYNEHAVRNSLSRMSPHAITKAVKKHRPNVLEGDKIVYGQHQKVWLRLGLCMIEPMEGAV